MKLGDFNIKKLHNAAKAKCLSKIKMYLNKGANVNSLNIKGETIFHVAIQQNDVDTVQYLINRYLVLDAKANADLPSYTLNFNAKNIFGETALHLAVKYNHRDLIALLFKCNLRANEVTNKGSTALHYAVETQRNNRESVLLVESLLKFNIKIDAKNKKGETPLHLAVKWNKYLLTRMLLSLNANVNSKTKYLFTPIFEAVKNGNTRMIKLLLKNGADVNVSNNLEDNPLLYAIKVLPEGKTQLDIALLLLKAGVKVNHQNYNRSSALFLAVHKRIEALVHVLISYDSCVNMRNQYDRTPLYVAIGNDMNSVVALLISKGADVNATVSRSPFTRESPLRYAVERGNFEVVNLLLGHGADPNLELLGCRTPLNEAIMLGYENIGLRLLKGGANVNMRDAFCDAPLHLISALCDIRGNYERLMQQLLYFGADIDVRNVLDKTPLELLQNDNKVTLRFGFILVKHMALRRFQDLEIGVNNVRTIASNVQYSEKFIGCIKELLLMRSSKVARDVSFYDLLVTRSNKMVRWVSVDNIVDRIEDEIFLLRFTNYHDMLVSNYRAARRRLDLLRKGSVALMRIIGMRLPPETADMVCRMLRNDDLVNLDLSKNRRACSAPPPKSTMCLRKKRKI